MAELASSGACPPVWEKPSSENGILLTLSSVGSSDSELEQCETVRNPAQSTQIVERSARLAGRADA